MKIKTNHAVLSATGMFIPQRIEVPNFVLTDVMQKALDHGITHVWTNVEFPLFPDVKGKILLDGWDLLIVRKGKRLKSVTGWRAGGSAQVQVIFIRQSRWAQGRYENVWGKVCTPPQLLGTVKALEEKLGVPVGASPGGTGWKLFEMFHPEWVKNAPKADLKAMHLYAGHKGSSQDLIFQKLYSITDGKFLHKVDRNSAYLYAAFFDLFYGVGEPSADSDGSKFDGRSPGAWECTVIPTEEALPDYPKGTYWLATPVINLMRFMKYEVYPHHGNYWQHRDKKRQEKDGKPSDAHQVMAKLADFLWKCRQSFPEGSFERQSIKQIAIGTVGLASYGDFEEEEETDKRRPDIKCLTVARTYELMMHSILKFRRQTGLNPLLCYMDALYYVSDSPIPDFLAPLLVRSTELGGFKYEGYVEITPEVADTLSSNSALFDKLTVLNKIGWRK
jgi:hypothetical protein